MSNIKRVEPMLRGTLIARRVRFLADIKLDDFVDQDVTLVGKGTQTEKDGKKRISIKTITSITKGGGGEAGGEAMEAE